MNLDRAGSRFLSAMQESESESFANSRQDAKSSIRAKRHDGEKIQVPQDEFGDKARKYKAVRRRVILDAWDSRVGDWRWVIRVALG